MKINQLRKLLAVAGLATVSTINQASAAGFTSSVLTPITFNGGGAVVSAQVFWGYFGNLNQATVTSGVAGLSGDSLLGYYHSNFITLASATMSGAAGSQYNTTINTAAEAAADGKNIWAIVQAQVGGAGDFYNGLFVQVDDFANPVTNWNWSSTEFVDALANTFIFAASGDAVVEDYSVTSLAVLGTSAGSTLSLSSVTTGTAIPEPASGSLFLLGAAGVLALRRLRKNNV